MPKAKTDRERLIDFSYRANNDQLKEAIELFSAALRARTAKADKPKSTAKTADKPKKGDTPPAGGEGDTQ